MKGKMKRLMTVCAALALVAMTGCVGRVMPQTTIKGSIGGKPFSVTTPKDSELAGLEITAQTNGAVSVKLQSLKAQINPEAVATTGAAQTAIINATADVVSKATEAGMRAAAAGVK